MREFPPGTLEHYQGSLKHQGTVKTSDQLQRHYKLKDPWNAQKKTPGEQLELPKAPLEFPLKFQEGALETTKRLEPMKRPLEIPYGPWNLTHRIPLGTSVPFKDDWNLLETSRTPLLTSGALSRICGTPSRSTGIPLRPLVTIRGTRTTLNWIVESIRNQPPTS